MINRVGKFSKVSLNQFTDDMKGTFGDKYSDNEIERIYNDIKLPQRATARSSGYDIRTTIDFTLNSGEEIKFPTGIKVQIDSGWWLMCMPRSGSGFKYRVRLANTLGNIDEDYIDADNEGHIWIKLTRDSSVKNTFVAKEGDAVCQGVFTQYGITYNDNTTEKRVGGIGSTGK